MNLSFTNILFWAICLILIGWAAYWALCFLDRMADVLLWITGASNVFGKEPIDRAIAPYLHLYQGDWFFDGPYRDQDGLSGTLSILNGEEIIVVELWLLDDQTFWGAGESYAVTYPEGFCWG